jgi:spore coat polysaccharide biosynthesis protein SpsF (cytidylyltransferase family)
VTQYIRKNGSLFTLVNVEYKTDLSAKRWTIDNPEDYEFTKNVYGRLFNVTPLFGMEHILDYISKNPVVESINSKIKRNEGLQKSLEEDKIFTIKESKER